MWQQSFCQPSIGLTYFYPKLMAPIIYILFFQYYGPQCQNSAAFVLIVGNVIGALTVLFNVAFQWFYPTGHKTKLVELAALLVQLAAFIWGGVLVFSKLDLRGPSLMTSP